VVLFISFRVLAVALLGLLSVQLAGVQHTLAQQPPGAAKSASAPQFALPPEVAARLGRATAQLAEVDRALANISEAETELGELRTKVEEALEGTTAAAEALRPELAAIKSQIDKLGSAPGKDEHAEPPEMAAERSRLTALAAAYDGAIKSSDLSQIRAQQLIERITLMRHALFTKSLMTRLKSPLTPGAWREMAASTSGVGAPFTAWATHWWNKTAPKGSQLWLLLAGTGILYALLKLVLWRTTHRRTKRTEPPLPTFFERAVSAVWVAALRVVPLLVAGFVLFVGLDALELIAGNPWGQLIATGLKAVLMVAAVLALVRAVLAPAEPQWRLVPLAGTPARRLTRLLGAMAAVYALDGVLTEAVRAFYVPLPLSVAQSIGLSLIFAALLIGVLLTPFTPQDHDASEPFSRHRPRLLKLPLWLVAIGIVGAALLGYAALARFASQQLVLTGLVALLCWLGYLAIRAFTREPTEQSRALGAALEHRLGLDQPRRQQLASLTEVALTFALILCAIPFLMLQWGFSAADIRDWSKSLLFGFEIGQFRISLVRILAGIVLFIALLVATRLIQRWMHERAAQSRIDPGIANSIETVLGYAGTWLAALVALSYAGLDITSLAIVAGALSVGIGFGLQSIVNNFVSGLILLIERPIKVGDRVVIGDKEGHVRRISVRATEVETFDRASVIVPNSELITGRVVNWSHRDWRGAVSVKVGVAYDADPDKVIAILKQCAAEHPLVLPQPPPGVSLDAFGDSALIFSLRVSLPDIDKAGEVQSDLRLAILKALRAAGIDIPFNHLDVTLRDVEALKAHLSEVLRQLPNGASREPDAKSTSAHPREES
jgi:potassium-dependent mechanosensitive channel